MGGQYPNQLSVIAEYRGADIDKLQGFIARVRNQLGKQLCIVHITDKCLLECVLIHGSFCHACAG
ncbi:hypothetical protein D3C86_676800 [compost metagenome]